MNGNTLPRVPRWAHYWPAVAGAIAVALALLDIVVATSPTRAGTAAAASFSSPLALGGLGIALLLATATPGLRRLRRAFEIAALLLAVLGVLGSSAAHQPPFGRQLSAVIGPSSLSASVAAALCALALLTDRLDAPRRMLPQVLAWLALALGFLTLLGHMFEAPLLYRPLPLDAPFGTLGAVVVIVLGSGSMALHVQQGMQVLAPTLGGMQLRWSLFAAIIVPLVMGTLALQIEAAYPYGSLAIALMAAGTTLLLIASGKAASVRLRRVEARLDLKNRALASVPQGVFVVERLERGEPNLYVNAAYRVLLGYGTDDATAPSFEALSIFAEDSAAAELTAALRDNRSRRLALRRRDGSVFPAKVSLSTVSRAEGGDCVIALIEDVTAEELAAQQRLALLAETAQARADAEAANRAKDAFFASMSHDLRSPLNACVMWLDVLALIPEPDKVAKAVDALKRNLGKQTRLVNDLIDAAKISSGGIEVRLEPLDLATLVTRNLDSWRSLAAAKQQTLEHRIDTASVWIDGDSDRLVQILNSVVENALANTPPAGRIALTLRSRGGEILLAVEDAGPALSPEAAAAILKPSWEQPSPARGQQNLRLGLTIAQHLVAKHKGTFTVTNRAEGNGTVFSMTFPASLRGRGLHASAALSTGP